MKCISLNKCYRVQKGHSRMDNPEKLATRKTKKNKKKRKKNHNTICVGHHYNKQNTNNLNKT